MQATHAFFIGSIVVGMFLATFDVSEAVDKVFNSEFLEVAQQWLCARMESVRMFTDEAWPVLEPLVTILIDAPMASVHFARGAMTFVLCAFNAYLDFVGDLRAKLGSHFAPSTGEAVTNFMHMGTAACISLTLVVVFWVLRGFLHGLLAAFRFLWFILLLPTWPFIALYRVIVYAANW